MSKMSKKRTERLLSQIDENLKVINKTVAKTLLKNSGVKEEQYIDEAKCVAILDLPLETRLKLLSLMNRFAKELEIPKEELIGQIAEIEDEKEKYSILFLNNHYLVAFKCYRKVDDKVFNGGGTIKIPFNVSFEEFFLPENQK